MTHHIYVNPTDLHDTSDPAAAIATASHWLEQASAAAGQLAHALDQGQQAIAHAAAADD